ncbi:MAG: sulfurtransferase complex subunit TusD [Halioglobus sp.]
MIYSLLVLSGPTSGRGSRIAAQFAHALLRQGHSIHRVFFLDEGAENGNASAIFPQDEDNPARPWIELAEGDDVELILCITSALRRGLLDERESQRHEKQATIHPAFEIAGLGQLVDACAASDRVLTFGG